MEKLMHIHSTGSERVKLNDFCMYTLKNILWDFAISSWLLLKLKIWTKFYLKSFINSFVTDYAVLYIYYIRDNNVVCWPMFLWEGRWPSGRVEASEPGGPGFDSSSRQPQVVAHQHWARWITALYTLVLCCAWLVTMALHVHCGLGQLSPLPTSGDDKWVAAKHCGRAKRCRISYTDLLYFMLN